MGEKGISRRRLVQVLMGFATAMFSSTSIAAALRYLWPAQAKNESAIIVRIAAAYKIQKGCEKKFLFAGKPAILLNMSAGFRAFGAVCTHLGCIAYRKPDKNDIFCPCHLGRFDPKFYNPV